MASSHNNEQRFEGKVINRRFKILTAVGSGSFGKVFMALDQETREYMAVKVEENKKDDKLRMESKILQSLNNQVKKKQGIPMMHWFGTDSNFSNINFMVTDMLGPNLEDLLKVCSGKFSMKTVLMIAENCLNLLEYVHERHYIHRDVKPENFLTGIGNMSHVIHLVDYGLSQRYRDPNTLCHTTFKENRAIVGTARYLSVNGHYGIEGSRRDDLESLGYMLVYLLNGTLPWKNINDNPNKQDKYIKIGEKKVKTLVESYCKNLPDEFAIYLNYSRSLLFDEKPDYVFLRKLFEDLFNREHYVKDYAYDWTIKENINMKVISNNKLHFTYQIDEEENDLKEESQHNSNQQNLSKFSRDGGVSSHSNSDDNSSETHNIYNNSQLSEKSDRRYDDTDTFNQTTENFNTANRPAKNSIFSQLLKKKQSDVPLKEKTFDEDIPLTTNNNYRADSKPSYTSKGTMHGQLITLGMPKQTSNNNLNIYSGKYGEDVRLTEEKNDLYFMKKTERSQNDDETNNFEDEDDDDSDSIEEKSQVEDPSGYYAGTRL
jgi:serine/threonine protein kinase